MDPAPLYFYVLVFHPVYGVLYLNATDRGLAHAAKPVQRYKLSDIRFAPIHSARYLIVISVLLSGNTAIIHVSVVSDLYEIAQGIEEFRVACLPFRLSFIYCPGQFEALDRPSHLDASFEPLLHSA